MVRRLGAQHPVGPFRCSGRHRLRVGRAGAAADPGVARRERQRRHRRGRGRRDLRRHAGRRGDRHRSRDRRRARRRPARASASATARARACPCGNAGAPGNGCANSVSASGRARSTQSASRASRTTRVVLVGARHAEQLGALLPGHDADRRRAGRRVRRRTALRGRIDHPPRARSRTRAAASQYPAAGDPIVSVRGMRPRPATCARTRSGTATRPRSAPRRPST